LLALLGERQVRQIGGGELRERDVSSSGVIDTSYPCTTIGAAECQEISGGRRCGLIPVGGGQGRRARQGLDRQRCRRAAIALMLAGLITATVVAAALVSSYVGVSAANG
jgi:hypothetical protein